MNRVKIGLALGGGGVRGAAHVGVFEVLEQEQIPIDLIVGTSFGSIVGAMYATHPSISDLKQTLDQFLESPAFKKIRTEILRRSLREGKRIRLHQHLKSSARRGILLGLSVTRGYFISEQEFGQTLEGLLSDGSIEKTRIPFRCVATDLVNGESVVFSKGPLRTAVQASCSFPGVFQPVHDQQGLLVDGGWVGPVPVDQAREKGIDLVFAVDTSEERTLSEEMTNGLQLVGRAHDMTKRALNELLIKKADVVVRPDIGKIHWTQFSEASNCIQQGRKAALDALPLLRREIERCRRMKEKGR